MAALNTAKDATREKPLFFNIRTTIDVGSPVAGKAVAHRAPFGSRDVVAIKKAYGQDPE